MASPARRDKLAQVAHDKRYGVSLDNPFPAVTFNSDRLTLAAERGPHQ